jgi:LPXTG-motif cell wall-anchored protein
MKHTIQRAALALVATGTMALGSGVAANAYPPGSTDAPTTTIDDGQPVAPTTTIDDGQPVAPTTTIDGGQPVAPSTTVAEEPGGTLPPTGSGSSNTGTIALGLVVAGGLLTVAGIRRRQTA